MQNYLWLILTISSASFAFYFLYLFVTQRQRGRILKQNLNVEKVTTSPGGIPMIWISENEFFIDIEVDRNNSWKGLIEQTKLDLDGSEIQILKLMPKLDVPEKKIERLYFRRMLYNSVHPLNAKRLIKLTEDLKPDPFILLTLFVKEKEFFNKYQSFSIWQREGIPKYNPSCLLANNTNLHGLFYEETSPVNASTFNYWATGRKD